MAAPQLHFLQTSTSSVEPLLLSRRRVQTRLALPFHAPWKVA
jgi:hypothetical protein